MDDIKTQISEVFYKYTQAKPAQIEPIPQSGGDRRYFRVHANGKSYIATYNLNIKENNTFVYFSKHFAHLKLPVPKVLHINDVKTIYIQEDVGYNSLLNILEEKGYTDEVYKLFQQSLKQLAHIQIIGDKGLDYNACLTAKEFGKQAILSDLLYFKYYFLDTLRLPYDKQAILDDFEALSTYLTRTAYKHFMFRDFQSRNILVKNSTVHFIDFQGGMKGALQYDVASLLWQAKAGLSEEWKNNLLHYYINEANQLLPQPIDETTFISQYNGYVLIRLLQVLGAYGFRGLFERRAHFLTSIPLALRNLKWFIENKRIGIDLPEFERMLHTIVQDDIINQFEPLRANEQTPLVVKINSFSYLKNGIPKDESKNGGGFVFDCRGILNPGRFEEYKTLTGKDKPVIDFLEEKTKMPNFLNNVYNMVDIAVENYIERNFDSLMINFGCTGGQHRSVYAAEQTARHLKNKFGVKIELKHIEQEASVQKKDHENQKLHF